MLTEIHPPAKRKAVAMNWLSFNFQRCSFGAKVFVQNQGPLTLGTAWDSEVYQLTIDLQAQEEKATQAIRKKKVL